MVLAALAACQPAGSEQAVDTPLPSVTLDPLASVKDAILTAYSGMWKDFASAARTADWEDPGLADHTTGDAEAKLRYGLYLAREKGQVVKGDPRLLDPQIAELKPQNAPTKAAIVDCVDDTRFLIHDKDGGRAKGGEVPGRHRTTATLTLRKGSWYVTSYTLKEAGTC